MTYIPEGRDPQLWRQAQARTSFKSHFTVYLIMSVVFWVIWYFNQGPEDTNGLPWPVWPMFGWGIGVFSHFMGAYFRRPQNRVEEEYRKLVEEQKRREVKSW